MIHKKIHDHKTNRTINFFDGGDVEFVNPIEYYSESVLHSCVSMQKELLKEAKFPLPLNNEIAFNALKKSILPMAELFLNEIHTASIPENLLSLLQENHSKQKQESLLRGLNITIQQLMGFIFKAYSDYGFTFSQYSKEIQHKGLNENELPVFYSIDDDNSVKRIGESSLTDGQLKQAIQHRKVTISKFIDKGDIWHCFFFTFKSWRGEESWNNGQPHFHYISDKWGIERKKVLEQLQSEKYPSTKVHIGFIQNEP